MNIVYIMLTIEDYHINQYKYLTCLNIKPVLRYRSGPVQDFDCAV